MTQPTPKSAIGLISVGIGCAIGWFVWGGKKPEPPKQPKPAPVVQPVQPVQPPPKPKPECKQPEAKPQTIETPDEPREDYNFRRGYRRWGKR